MERQLHKKIIENKHEAYIIRKMEETRVLDRGLINLLFDKSLHKRSSNMNYKLQENNGKRVR